MSLLIRNVEVGSLRGLNVRIEAGRIVSIGTEFRPAIQEIDGRGGALIPGLCDHHIHLFGLAAQRDSVSLAGAIDVADLDARIALAISTRPLGAWLRVTGYHETMAGDLTRADLDRLAPNHRMRVQHQTGSLWILNSKAIDAILGDDRPPGLECDADGRPTGRLWREDAWLRERIVSEPPDLASIGQTLAAFGITAVTDASVTTDASAARLLALAHRNGALPQRLRLMSGGALEAPSDGAFAVGAVKVLLDDHNLPDLDDFINRIAEAREWGRSVAVHCVTDAELALTLAAFHSQGARRGDRIEHGSVIPETAIGSLRELNLAVVTQSAFVFERGDRYLAEVALNVRGDLYRCGSLLAAGIAVAGSSDAPYASADPWLGIRSAIQRKTAYGRSLGAEEAITPSIALAMYLGDPASPGTRARRVRVGAAADLCLLDVSIDEALAAPAATHVRATFVNGEIVYARGD